MPATITYPLKIINGLPFDFDLLPDPLDRIINNQNLAAAVDGTDTHFLFRADYALRDYMHMLYDPRSEAAIKVVEGVVKVEMLEDEDAEPQPVAWEKLSEKERDYAMLFFSYLRGLRPNAKLNNQLITDLNLVLTEKVKLLPADEKGHVSKDFSSIKTMLKAYENGELEHLPQTVTLISLAFTPAALVPETDSESAKMKRTKKASVK